MKIVILIIFICFKTFITFSQIEVYKVLAASTIKFNKYTKSWEWGKETDMTPINYLILIDFKENTLQIVYENVMHYKMIEMLNRKDDYDSEYNKYNIRVFDGTDFNDIPCGIFIIDYYFKESRKIQIVYVDKFVFEFVCKKIN